MYVVLVVSFGCLVGWLVYVRHIFLPPQSRCSSLGCCCFLLPFFKFIFLPFVFVFVVVVDGSGNVNGTVVICYWSV